MNKMIATFALLSLVACGGEGMNAELSLTSSGYSSIENDQVSMGVWSIHRTTAADEWHGNWHISLGGDFAGSVSKLFPSCELSTIAGGLATATPTDGVTSDITSLVFRDVIFPAGTNDQQVEVVCLVDIPAGEACLPHAAALEAWLDSVSFVDDTDGNTIKVKTPLGEGIPGATLLLDPTCP